MKSLNVLPTIVVAGCSSGSGKTSVAVAITEALSRLCPIAAAKITVTHGDRGCPHGGRGCNVCSSLGGDYQIITDESIIRQQGTDTARLQIAGGNPVLWAITRDVAIPEAWQGIINQLSDVKCVVVESNSLAQLIVPTLTLMVVDPTVSRKIWKPSALGLIESADFIVFNNRGPQDKSDVLLREVSSIRKGLRNIIVVPHPNEITANSELLDRLYGCVSYVVRTEGVAVCNGETDKRSDSDGA